MLTLTSRSPASSRPASETPMEPAFREIIRGKTGMFIWRVVVIR